MTEEQEIKKMSELDVGSMLHAVLFAYEKVLINFYGKEEAKKLLSYLIEELIPILYDEKNKVIDKELGIDENMKRLAAFLSDDKILKGLKIEKVSLNEFVIDIKECAFAKEGIHSVLDLKGGSCPWALIAAAVLSSVEAEDQYINIGSSEFTDDGSKTYLKIE
jgi:hypothetical protein